MNLTEIHFKIPYLDVVLAIQKQYSLGETLEIKHDVYESRGFLYRVCL